MAENKARTKALEWWRARVDTGDAVDIKQLSRKAVLELGSDPGFRDAFVDDFLEGAMYELGQRIVAARRAELRTPTALRKRVEEEGKRAADTWDRWLEYVPDAGVHIPLPNMTREQVLAASANYQAIADSNAIEARWLKLIANELRPGQVVGDVLTQSRVEEIRRSIRPKVRKAA